MKIINVDHNNQTLTLGVSELDWSNQQKKTNQPKRNSAE